MGKRKLTIPSCNNLFTDLARAAKEHPDMRVVIRKAMKTLRDTRDYAEHCRLLAYTNSVTNAPNKRQLEEDLKDPERRNRKEGNLYLAMCDIDYFKRFNDEYGHAVGDKVLRITSDILGRVQREADFAGAYHLHGEEMVLAYSAPDDIAALRVADRRRLAVASGSVRAGSPKEITLSLGVTKFEKGEKLETTLERTDGNLYIAKEAGRNRVCLANLGSHSPIIYPN
jgi:diguanylate cyclase